MKVYHLKSNSLVSSVTSDLYIKIINLNYIRGLMLGLLAIGG